MKNPLEVSKKAYNRILKVDRVVNDIENLNNRLSEVISTQNQIDQKIQHLENENENLRKMLVANKETNELFFFSLFQKTNENNLETRKRFFNNMPKAYGDLRTLQLGLLKLLKSFDAICKSLNLTYMIQGGTLLGAVRHHGFIPWDDDIDLLMTREDYEKLQKYLKNNKDFRITLAYDWYVQCRQIRFRTTDNDNPCFLDIMLYDYGKNDDTYDWDKEWLEKKTQIYEKMLQENPDTVHAWEKEGCVDSSTPLGKKVGELFKKYYDSQIDHSITKDNYTSLDFGIDNIVSHFNRTFTKNLMFPVVKLKFENIEVPAPKEYNLYLKRQYGDIYEIPDNLGSQFKHLDQNNIDVTAIEKYLSS